MMARDHEDEETAARKRALLGDLHGDVLEIGPGAGPNLAYYAPDVRWIGVEPNPHMHEYLMATAKARGRVVDLRLGHAEALPAADGSMDAVVSTHVLCSVHDLEGALAEVRRVLKPGGKLVFLEHVAAAPHTGLRRVQNTLRPLWKVVGDGCHPNRETWRAIEQAGFREVQIEHYRIDAPIVSPHIAGYAVN
jgi:SAM-dependent methyltransferase